MKLRRALLLFSVLVASVPSLALAQSVTIPSATNEPALGNVSSASSGNTVFRASAADGTVTRTSGTGYRISSGNTRSLVTLGCGTSSFCDTRDIDITISSTGTPTGRAAALTNFTVRAGTAV